MLAVPQLNDSTLTAHLCQPHQVMLFPVGAASDFFCGVAVLLQVGTLTLFQSASRQRQMRIP
jgi:hypothetical protein